MEKDCYISSSAKIGRKKFEYIRQEFLSHLDIKSGVQLVLALNPDGQWECYIESDSRSTLPVPRTAPGKITEDRFPEFLETFRRFKRKNKGY